MRHVTVAGLAVVLLLGCKPKKDEEPAARPESGDEVVEKVEKGEPEPVAEPEPEPVELPERASVALEGKAKSYGVPSLPDTRENEPYALAGTPAVPSWSVEGGDPEAARDDDLLTTWTCTPEEMEEGAGEGGSCALGLVFPSPAEVVTVRLFASAGEGKTRRPTAGRSSSVSTPTPGTWTRRSRTACSCGGSIFPLR